MTVPGIFNSLEKEFIMNDKKIAVVALGGNAISVGGNSTIYEEFANTRSSLKGILPLIEQGYELVITHGNGPQVGNKLAQVEATMDRIPPLPLGVLVADTEGSIGYMIQQSLQNALHRRKINRSVVTVVTQVIVDKNDPSILNPTKPIGQFYPQEVAEKLAKEQNWHIVEDAGRGWRRVVPSPMPLQIVEKNIIKRLFEEDVIVIAAGGGGIPIYLEDDGTYEGIDAVIDKDYASAVLANDLDADLLVILTGVDRVAIGFNTPNCQYLDRLTVAEAEKHLAAGEFPKGSMGPKIKAAINYLKAGGKEVLISSVERAAEAIAGETGTRIYLD